jgi:adenine-specific DNA-methyltransferase
MQKNTKHPNHKNIGRKHKRPAPRSAPTKLPPANLQTTTLWDFPSQQYGEGGQGSKDFTGATPAYVIWNVLQRYTQIDDLVVDPMCGSGTTLDVCKELSRRPMCFDLVPFRNDIKQCDARNLPLKNNTVDCVFIDPPYSDHIEYSDHGKCIGKLSSESGKYYDEMQKVIKEMHRVLKPGKHLALYVSDSWKKGVPFQPIGFQLFGMMSELFEPVDIISVVRHNRTLLRNHWHTSAADGNFFLRGFNYLFIMRKAES